MATAPALMNPLPPIPVRKVHLPFDESIPRHWLAENAFETHVFNGLNLVFPDGERFFIRAVRDHLDQVDDPALRSQVEGFFGQEGVHAREHERYFDILRAQGYRVDAFLGRFRRFSRWTSRRLPAALRLSMTAGAEHWTATLGALALNDAFLDEAHPTMRQLILWHAAEEVEHKSVAFDVLRTTHPSYLLRVTGFVIATALLFGWAAVGTRMLLRQDGIGRRQARSLAEEARRRRGHDEVPDRVRRGVRAYFRRDFHPSEEDDAPIAAARLAELGMATGA